jgi:hypothetical protein
MILGKILGTKTRIIVGWIMFVGSLIGWPMTIWLTDEPRFILSLSWLAIVLEAWNMVQIAEVDADVETEAETERELHHGSKRQDK